MLTYLITQLSDPEKKLIASAINTYGDGQHPVATPDKLDYFKMGYIAHCLGRQHFSVIGAGLMKAPEEQDEKHLALHSMHDNILDLIEDAIEFGREA